MRPKSVIGFSLPLRRDQVDSRAMQSSPLRWQILWHLQILTGIKFADSNRTQLLDEKRCSASSFQFHDFGIEHGPYPSKRDAMTLGSEKVRDRCESSPPIGRLCGNFEFSEPQAKIPH